MKKRVRRVARDRVAFVPSREYLNDAVKEFLASGGKITRIYSLDRSYIQIVDMNKGTQSEADDFLLT